MKSILITSFVLLRSISIMAQSEFPADKNATTETIRLYNNLKQTSKKGFLFGHQDALAYGVKWKYQEGRSDIKDVTGDYPAIYGWDLSHLELDEKLNIDSVPFDNMSRYIKEGYARGGVITISWHGTNPMNGKTSWDNTPGTVASILPGGAKHEFFKAQLDRIAAFLLALKDKNGKLIPVLYRPFHELTGNWFWWGSSACTPEELKSIFRFSVLYLRDVKKVHNLLTVYNTSANFNSAESYLQRYPGDDVVDVLSFDDYQSGNPANGARFAQALNNHLSIIGKLAAEKNKLSAVAEAGYNQIPDPQWWTNVILKGLSGHTPAYLLMWRNAGVKPDRSVEYFVPYPGQVSASDFIKFYEAPQTLFQKDVAKENLYKK